MISLSEFLFDYPLYTKVYGEDAVKIFSELKGGSFDKVDAPLASNDFFGW